MTQTKTKNYRAVFILDSRGETRTVEEMIEALKGTLGEINARVEKAENLGVRDFARSTEKDYTSGAYVQIDFEGEPTTPDALREKLHLEKFVNRIQIHTV